MDNKILAALDKDVVSTYKKLQYGYGFRRVLNTESENEESESVTYPEGSVFRLWINQETLSYSLHWHPAAEIIVPLDNNYYVTIDNVRHVLKPGDIFIIPSCELHQIDAPENGRRLILLFDFVQFEHLHNFSYIRSYLTKPVLINPSTCPSIYGEELELISGICKDYFGDDNLRDSSIYAKILIFFINYARFCSANVALNGYSPNNKVKKQELQQCFSTVYEYIDKHLSDDLALETVAEVACFSKFHFSRIFKEYSGYSFYDYVRMQRIKSAANLLLNPNLSITEISLQTGFANLTTFNRTFKAIKGCTPTDYRKLFSEA